MRSFILETQKKQIIIRNFLIQQNLSIAIISLLQFLFLLTLHTF